MSACTFSDLRLSLEITGKPNAPVFPVPVCALPIKSLLEVSIWGIAFSWMEVGFSNPISVMAVSISGRSPKSLNVDII
jgi:hypothetical protein